MSVWSRFSDAWQRVDTRWLYSSPCSAHQTTSDHPWSACTQRADDQRITLRSSFWSDPWAKKSATFRNFPCTADQSAGYVGVLLCSEQKAVSANIDFGDNLLGTDWVCGYSQLGYLVTWQILSVTRSVERWCDIAIFSDSDYWKHPKHGTSSRTFRNECRRALSFCDYLPKSVFLQPNRNARK